MYKNVTRIVSKIQNKTNICATATPGNSHQFKISTEGIRYIKNNNCLNGKTETSTDKIEANEANAAVQNSENAQNFPAASKCTPKGRKLQNPKRVINFTQN